MSCWSVLIFLFLAPPCSYVTALTVSPRLRLIIARDVASVPKSSVGCCAEKEDTITKITKTASLGKIETVQNVANPDPGGQV